jgi:hypothetical protein
MGTVTYRGMSQTWPASGHPVAEPLNRLPKLVFTTGSGQVDTTWGRFASSAARPPRPLPR